jgi:hypothetical protein
MGDWVHEDDVLSAGNLPVRRNCAETFDPEQTAVLLNWWQTHGCPDSVVHRHLPDNETPPDTEGAFKQ